MKPNDSDEQPGDAYKNALGVLEYFASDLDSMRYPGQAWSAQRGVVSYRISWKFVASIAGVAGIAALIALAFHFAALTSHPIKVASTASNNSISRPTAPPEKIVLDQDATPRIVIVEDMDSYSIIDMTGAAPLVSFARRDSDGFDDATPVFVAPVSEATTKNAPL